MPSDHISNLEYNRSLERPVDWEGLYKEKAIDLIKLRNRCSQYRQAAEYALEYLHETKDAYHPALNITNLSEKSTWTKIKDKRRLRYGFPNASKMRSKFKTFLTWIQNS